ncbi:MAG: radical SAM protein [Chitinivibrionales bacterium]|nr:radical SAM protein [Chitinivibrionales bacterium]
MDVHKPDPPARCFRPTGLMLEFTTRCNLRCEYCNYITPQYRCAPDDIDQTVLESLIDFCIKHKISKVDCFGRGETTLYKNWHHYCDCLFDHGVNLGIITNLAKDYSPEEFSTLARFASIEASCDTADPELFKNLRRGNTMQRFLTNIKNIWETALMAGRTPPAVAWSCVVCDRTVFGLADFVKVGRELGISAFKLNGYERGNPASTIKPLEEMAPDKFIEAAQLLQKLMQDLAGGDIILCVAPGLIDKVNARLAALDVIDNPAIAGVEREREGRWTRACTNPWFNATVQADGALRPCCAFERPLDMLRPGHGLEDAFNGDAITALRRSLLTGELLPECRACPIASWTPLREHRAALENLMRQLTPHAPAPAPRFAPVPELVV